MSARKIDQAMYIPLRTGSRGPAGRQGLQQQQQQQQRTSRGDSSDESDGGYRRQAGVGHDDESDSDNDGISIGRQPVVSPQARLAHQQQLREQQQRRRYLRAQNSDSDDNNNQRQVGPLTEVLHHSEDDDDDDEDADYRPPQSMILEGPPPTADTPFSIDVESRQQTQPPSPVETQPETALLQKAEKTHLPLPTSTKQQQHQQQHQQHQQRRHQSQPRQQHQHQQQTRHQQTGANNMGRSYAAIPSFGQILKPHPMNQSKQPQSFISSKYPRSSLLDNHRPSNNIRHQQQQQQQTPALYHGYQPTTTTTTTTTSSVAAMARQNASLPYGYGDDSDSDFDPADYTEDPNAALAGQLYGQQQQQRPSRLWSFVTAVGHLFSLFSRRSSSRPPQLSPHDNAMLMWHSLGSTDEFYQNVYDYYIGKGLRNIVLAQVLNLVSLAFVACFAVFLAYGIDYSLIRTKNRLIDVIAPGFPGTLPIGIKLFMIVFLLFWTWQLVRVVYDARQVYPMRDFFEYVLDIPREDIETIDWNIVVQKITELREKDIASGRQSSVQAKRIDAMDITNRIMRKENYLIALFNRDLLNLANPFPMVPFVGSRETLTKTLEWNLSFCLFNYVFDDKGQLRKRFLRDHRRTVLADGLRRRFIFMGVINLLLAPFVVVFLLLYFFFRYAEEIYRNPGSVGMRTYSTLARWKFRGFNELPHVFQQRLNRSYEPAVKYLEQFPNEMMAIFARFTSLITGAFAGVLLILAVLDPDLSLQFEITPNRSVLFYIGLFGGILAMSRGMIPSDHETFDPAGAFNVMASYTLYMPTEWRDRTHTLYVRDEMSKMFAPKILLFIDELLGIVFTPFILLFSLSKCSAEVVDFFREFSVHVDGVGYVCSFAKFDFKRHGNIKFGAPARVDNQYLTSKNGKMEQSFLAFKANHPTWEPRDPAASTFLNRANLARSMVFNRPPTSARPTQLPQMPQQLQQQQPMMAKTKLPDIQSESPPPHHYPQQHQSPVSNADASQYDLANEMGMSVVIPPTMAGSIIAPDDQQQPGIFRTGSVLNLVNQLYEQNLFK